MANLDEHLQRTSRTFALTIPLLPEPTRRAVSIAYLLFRIADTFEDSTTWSIQRRVEALDAFSKMLEDEPTADEARIAGEWADGQPVEHEGYNDLLRDTPMVLGAFRELGPDARRIVRHHVRRTAVGMAAFVERTREGDGLGLDDIEDLREYCYIVAGIVGEMLTELFLAEYPTANEAAEVLLENARWFGEGLQLTNILKDFGTDRDEGRHYIAPGVDTNAVFEMAREDLGRAERYTHALFEAGAPRGLVAFNALPLMLAWATLDRVQRDGPGAKLSRAEVASIVNSLDRALEEGVSAFSRNDANAAVLSTPS